MKFKADAGVDILDYEPRAGGLILSTVEILQSLTSDSLQRHGGS